MHFETRRDSGTLHPRRKVGCQHSREPRKNDVVEPKEEKPRPRAAPEPRPALVHYFLADVQENSDVGVCCVVFLVMVLWV